MGPEPSLNPGLPRSPSKCTLLPGLGAWEPPSPWTRHRRGGADRATEPWAGSPRAPEAGAPPPGVSAWRPLALGASAWVQHRAPGGFWGHQLPLPRWLHSLAQETPAESWDFVFKPLRQFYYLSGRFRAAFRNVVLLSLLTQDVVAKRLPHRHCVLPLFSFPNAYGGIFQN